MGARCSPSCSTLASAGAARACGARGEPASPSLGLLARLLGIAGARKRAACPRRSVVVARPEPGGAGAATASGNFVRLRESSGAAERCCFVDVRANPGYVSIGGPLFYRYGATRVHCGGDDDEFDRHPVFGVLFGDSSYCGCTLTYCYCTTYISYT
ncbi:unnamed protein product [Arctia plantaginis]|uniref:Uncharacterized protein n=1 Tax=Arctia plantaginis TaxID=874455 RepID=A0A8S1BR14_ARCPL|nr:unnamed protein product [Arctia plantaginis]